MTLFCVVTSDENSKALRGAPPLAVAAFNEAGKSILDVVREYCIFWNSICGAQIALSWKVSETTGSLSRVIAVVQSAPTDLKTFAEQFRTDVTHQLWRREFRVFSRRGPRLKKARGGFYVVRLSALKGQGAYFTGANTRRAKEEVLSSDRQKSAYPFESRGVAELVATAIGDASVVKIKRSR